MLARSALLIVLIAAIAALSIVFARPLLGLPASSASPARPSAAATTAASPSASPAAAPSPAPSPSAPASPTPQRTPTASCPPVPAGGSARSVQEFGVHALSDVRVAHQPGLDRVVFDFGQERSLQDDLTPFRIERASSFTNVAGQQVRVEGSAFWSVRFDGASIADQRGNLVYKGPRDLDPTTSLVRDVKLIEDFEAVMIWAIGLAQLECPRVSTLRSPLRLVIDLPSPPF